MGGFRGIGIAQILILAVIISILGCWSMQRNRTWQTEIGLWTDCAEKAPKKERPWGNLMAALILDKQYQRAKDCGLKALECESAKGQYYLYYNLSVAEVYLDDLPGAYDYARQAVAIEKNTLNMVQLGLVLQKMGYQLTQDRKYMVRVQ